MKNIIVDPLMHFPSLGKIFLNDDYLTLYNPNNWVQSYYSKQEFISIYQREPICFINEREKLENEYENAFFIFPFQDFNTVANPFRSDLFSFFNKIYSYFEGKIKNKIIFIDNSDLPVLDMEDSEYNFSSKLGLKYDILFKKEYNINATYNDKTHPFPFCVMGRRDCFWILNERRRENLGYVTDKVFWSGHSTVVKTPEQLVNIDRPFWVSALSEYLDSSGESGNCFYGEDKFLQQVSQYKFSVHLKGFATLPRRFCELLSCDTLVLLEKLDLNLGIPSEEFLDEMCIFSTPEEFKEKFLQLKSNEDLYQSCLRKQRDLIFKYFNYNYVKNYIERFL